MSFGVCDTTKSRRKEPDVVTQHCGAWHWLDVFVCVCVCVNWVDLLVS